MAGLLRRSKGAGKSRAVVMKKSVEESDKAIELFRDRLLAKIKRHMQLILSLDGLTDDARRKLFNSFQQVLPEALLIGGLFKKQIEIKFTAARTGRARAYRAEKAGKWQEVVEILAYDLWSRRPALTHNASGTTAAIWQRFMSKCEREGLTPVKRGTVEKHIAKLIPLKGR
jgi:hypothetical protein